MNNIFKRINFRQPKYMLPAILYIPFSARRTSFRPVPYREGRGTGQDTPDDRVPESRIAGRQIKGGDGIGSKYENMAKSWGKIQDYSAVDNIERDEPDDNQEEYESQYTEEDIAPA